MRPTLAALLAVAALAGLLLSRDNATREISLSELRDRIEGGWAGQMIGVAFGAPTEFRFREKTIDVDLPAWTPDRISNALDQDDLYVDMTFARVLDQKGPEATTADFGAMFRQADYRLWHANLAARRALRRGVPAEKSGTPEFNAHANDIDFQIEADFVGLMAPGLPRSASDIAYRAGRVMNHGDGILGGIFVTCMYSAAFFESDPRKVVEAGLACLPEKSPYARTITDVLAWSQQNPQDWRAVWKLIESKWNKREPCPEGALKPFNIDARLNGAYIVLGLLHGGGDFDRTLDISTRAGQDSDCNPSNACGILGTMIGYRRIPDQWKSGIPAISGKKFSYTEFTFPGVVESTQRRAIALVNRHGGRLDGEKLTVRVQEPRPYKLDLWDDYGSPAERIARTDPRWRWKGTWRDEFEGVANQSLVANEKGAEASITFQGTGAILVGPYLPAGGTADVYLDGKLHKTVDVFPDEDQRKGGETVWHAFRLANREHTLRLVVRGEPYAGSKGTAVAITDLVVFRPAP